MYLKGDLTIASPEDEEQKGRQDHERRIRNLDNSDSDPPKLNQSGPPMNVVVITETPNSSAASDENMLLSPPPHAKQCDGRVLSLFDRTVPVTLGSSSFKLMPRKSTLPVVCSPSPARVKGQSGSRKRRANSISSPSALERDHEGAICQPFGKQDFSPPRLSPMPTTANDFLTMNGLSLHSPVPKGENPATCSPPKLPNQNICRPRTSSFSVYNSSPGGSIQRNGSGSLSGSMGVRTPCTSNKSSPRHAPLTILSTTSSQQGPSQGPSPMKLPLVGRPPFHSGLSKMLHSLDGREDADGVILSPCIPVSSRSLMHPSTPSMDASSSASMESSREHDTPKNGGGASSYASPSPRTPLPRVTLTPRTPLSARRALNSRLPEFPSSVAGDGFSFTPSPPRHDDDVDRMMDNILQGFTGHTPTPANQATPGRPLPVLNVVNRSSCHSLSLSVGSPESNPARPQTFCCPPPRFVELDDCLMETGRDDLVSRDPAEETMFDEGVQSLEIKTKSVMTPSRSGGYLSDMMKADARAEAVDAETGSLSDSDSDEEFVLAFPMSKPSPSKKDHQSSFRHERRVKQRRSSCKLEEERGNASMTSLTSNQASSTSLFGMDIVHEEGLSLCCSTPRVITQFSGQPQRKSFGSFSSLGRRDGEHGSTSSLPRGKSEVSLGSLGLCLEESTGEPGRDLRTPPVCIQRPNSPPPLAKRSLLSSGSQSSVSFSPADSNSVSVTISQMVFHKN